MQTKYRLGLDLGANARAQGYAVQGRADAKMLS
jgi:hypothetical protein